MNGDVTVRTKPSDAELAIGPGLGLKDILLRQAEASPFGELQEILQAQGLTQRLG